MDSKGDFDLMPWIKYPFNISPMTGVEKNTRFSTFLLPYTSLS